MGFGSSKRSGAKTSAWSRPADESRVSETSPPIVELSGVGRRFGDVDALHDLDLQVAANSITVLLGPNGAGKTTAIRMITGALAPDAGAVRVFGLDPAVDGEEVRRRCGVVSAKPALYDRLSGYDNLSYSAELYGIGRNADAPIREAAARFGIEHALDQQVGGYSTGMKTRLALARSVLHQPDLLLFDEPTSGLDPESSAAVLKLIKDMTATGATVLMCTHHLAEAEGLSDHIVILENGTDLLSGTQEDLTRRFWPSAVVRFGVEDRSQIEHLRFAAGVSSVDWRDDYAEIQLDDSRRIPDLVDLLQANRARITRVEPHHPSLEDLYFAVRRERAGDTAEVVVPTGARGTLLAEGEL